MSDSENLDYLQPGFDPYSLTMPRLRSILVTYNINYPATAKKAQLVDIFNDQVVPQAKKILNQRARAKRSSRGIVDAETSQSVSTDGFDDEDQAPPHTVTRRSRSPRKSARPAKHDAEEADDHQQQQQLRPAPALVASPRKRSARSASRQLPSDTDTDGDGIVPPRSVRASSRRAVTPNVKLEAPAKEPPGLQQLGSPVHGPAAASTDEDEAVFTSDNPFQSGSSPPQPPKSSARRRTAGPDLGFPSKAFTTPAKSSSSAARRRTDGPVFDNDNSAFEPRFEIPRTAIKSRSPKTPEHPTLEPGEEFTPDAQLEMALEESAHGRRSALARRPEQSLAATRKSFSLATPLWVLLLTLLGAYATWYRQEKVKVGYCEIGQPATEILPPEIRQHLPPWAEVLVEPRCEICPAHAKCFDDFTVACEEDYVLRPHPLSLGGIVPLPPTCEPDGEKARRVKAVADRAVEELRERRAQFECGELRDADGTLADSAAIEVEILKEVVGEKRQKKMSQQEFDDLWIAALGDIQGRDEVETEPEAEEEEVRTRRSGAVSNPRISSVSLARVPIACAVRRSFRLGLERHRLRIAAVVLAALAALWARRRWRSHVATAARVPALVDTVLERLAQQKELAYDGYEDDPFLFLPQLRDDVLRATHSLAERERIWSRVRAVVEQNSNVRQGQREGRDGEVGRAWEWIGPTAAGADGLGASGGPRPSRRSLAARASWGGGGGGLLKGEADDGRDGSPSARLRDTPTADRSGMHQKWQEGARPVF